MKANRLQIGSPPTATTYRHWKLLTATSASCAKITSKTQSRNLPSVGRIETTPDDGMNNFNVVLEVGKEAVAPNVVGQIFV